MAAVARIAPPTQPATPLLWADLAVLGVALVWGASYPVAKSALLSAPVLVLVFYRFLLTAGVMSCIARRELAVAGRADLLRGVVLGTILFLIFLAETCGVALTSATNAALIISLCTVFTPLLDYGLAGRRPPRGTLLGALMSCSGIAVLAGGITALSVGDLLVLCAAGLRAAMVVSTKRLMAGRLLSSAALTALQATTVGVLTLLVLLAQSGPPGLLVQAGTRFWASIGFLSLFCTIAAFYVQNAAVRRGSPTRVAFLMGTEPLFGFAIAHILLGEPVSAARLLEACSIVSGTFVGITAERRTRSSRQAPRPQA